MPVELKIDNNTYRLNEGLTIVGRGEDADIRVDSPKLSRTHARLKLEGEVLTVEDLGSKNGVFVNGTRIDKAVVLSLEDQLKLADFSCEIMRPSTTPAPVRNGKKAGAGRNHARKEQDMIKKLVAGIILAILLLAGYSYIKSHVPQELKNARLALDAAEQALVQARITDKQDANLDLLAEFDQHKAALGGIASQYAAEHPRAQALLKRIADLAAEIRDCNAGIEREAQAQKQLDEIKTALEHGALDQERAFRGFSALAVEFKNSPAAEEAAELAVQLEKDIITATAAAVAQSIGSIEALLASKEYSRALTAAEEALTVEYPRLKEEQLLALRELPGRIRIDARDYFERRAATAVQRAREGDCESLSRALQADFDQLGMGELESLLMDARSRITAIKNDRIARARAKLAKELKAAEELEAKRAYTEAAGMYTGLLTRISEAELKREVGRKQNHNNLMAAGKKIIINYVNAQGGITVQGMGEVSAMSTKEVTLTMEGTSMPLPWSRIRDSEFARLLAAALEKTPTALGLVCRAVLLLNGGSEREADNLLARARQLSADLPDLYPALYAALADRAAARDKAAARPRTGPPKDDLFTARWQHASSNAAVIYWRLNAYEKEGSSYVEYGPTSSYGRKTPVTRDARWAHLHHLTGLAANQVYHYRMVVNIKGKEHRSADAALLTRAPAGIVRLPAGSAAPPFNLNRSGATYVLTKDINSAGTAIQITGSNITLDLNGFTVKFGTDTDKKVFGILLANSGPVTVRNGRVVQGNRSGKYSAAVGSNSLSHPAEIYGITTEVNQPCSYPFKSINRVAGLNMHHNHWYSRVTEIENRHYPGNDLVRLDGISGTTEVRDNILSEGCHIGLRLGGGAGAKVDIHHNDIRHHQQYVNGYAFMAHCRGAEIHHNRITSTGRTVHLTGDGVKYHHNWADTKGHFHLSDMPAGSRPWKHRRVELHGIKFEGDGARNCKVYNNFMRITQHQPVDMQGQGEPENKIINGVYIKGTATAISGGRLVDGTRTWEAQRWRGYRLKYAPNLPAVEITASDATGLSGAIKAVKPGPYTIYFPWDYTPATPLNIACYNPNAMNEIYGNTIIALTTYKKTHHGGYGASGQWASSIYFVGMNKGPARDGQYSAYIHDNTFISNDLFVSAGAAVTNTIRIENNTFQLAPNSTAGHTPYRGIGPALTKAIKAGKNILK